MRRWLELILTMASSLQESVQAVLFSRLGSAQAAPPCCLQNTSPRFFSTIFQDLFTATRTGSCTSHTTMAMTITDASSTTNTRTLMKLISMNIHFLRRQAAARS